jgi:plastocyanin
MHRLTGSALLVGVSFVLAACADARSPTGALPTSSAARGVIASSPHAGGATRLISLMDACDSTSFANALHDPTVCVRDHGVPFDTFIAQVAKHGFAGAWHFAPPTVEARVGQTLLAVNRGGEVHTFTEVEEFGGGIVPMLNQLSGNTTVAPECMQLAPGDFIPPGGSTTDDVDEPGVEKYQCCIHPWMRTVVRIRGS